MAADTLLQSYNTSHHAANQTNTTAECEISTETFTHACLLPSMCIVLLFSFLERRKKVYSFENRFPYLRGRFGVVVPLDFTGTLTNRWSYTLAFMVVAPQVFYLVTETIKPLTFPAWLIAITYLVAAFEVGLANLPFFVCLSTKHRALGGALGLLYTLTWLIVKGWNFHCLYKSCDESTFIGTVACTKFLFWPYLLCLAVLLCQFGFILGSEVKNCRQKRNKQAEEDEVLQSHQYKYVQTLLRRPPERSVEKSWFRRKVYDSDTYFKFPSRMIATVVISIVGLYMFICFQQMFYAFHIKSTSKNQTSFWTDNLNDDMSIWFVATPISILASLAHTGRVLVCYRKHMKLLWAGNKRLLPKRFQMPDSAANMVAIVTYPGCQIAYTIWGYVIVHSSLYMLGVGFVNYVFYPLRKDFLSWFMALIISVGNLVVVLALAKLQAFVVQVFFLQDKLSPQDKNKPLALNNRKAFHNFNYFFFFYNVILGIWNCMERLIKSTFISLLLVSRIDRTIMPRRFEQLDEGFCTWVGMIMADHYHTNPVLVCFCHLLLKRTLEKHTAAESHPCTKKTPESPLEVRVRWRWLLLYTLLRNPKLILLRKHKLIKNEYQEHVAVVWATAQQEDTEDD